METADEKLSFLSSHTARSLTFDEVQPDRANNWVNLTSNDFDSLIPIGAKSVKRTSNASQEKAIFKMFSQGVKTNRDDWVWDWEATGVQRKVQHLISEYQAEVSRLNPSQGRENIEARLGTQIKWTRKLKGFAAKRTHLEYDQSFIESLMYRPFVRKSLYFSADLNEDWYQLDALFAKGKPNPTIAFLSVFSSNPLATLAVERPFDYCLLKMGNGGTECLSQFRYDAAGTRHDNITDWALKQFRAHFESAVTPRRWESRPGRLR